MRPGGKKLSKFIRLHFGLIFSMSKKDWTGQKKFDIKTRYFLMNLKLDYQEQIFCDNLKDINYEAKLIWLLHQ